ncbi:MAG: AmmeMemoRadiSam system protein B [Thermodesulfobacteriota bacterium]|nr:AmmeMemoRadiSam system protein B [Thermodesulfobacteriota bacterium]
MTDTIRKSVIAGSWYPGNPEVLRSNIEGYLKNVQIDDIEGRVVGLISPHAGYTYSGQVAAYSYKLIKDKNFDGVIVIGPSHRHYFKGASIYEGAGYETPLGVVPVDSKLAEQIMSNASGRISYVSAAHSQEHSVEIQLPFLQVALGEFSFVPIVMGVQSRETCKEVAEAIYESIKDKNALVVGSSDLSHFHSYDDAMSMDSIVIDHMDAMDAEGLLKSLEKGTCEACGGGPIAVTMMVAEKLGATDSKVLKYANSGDVTGDRRGVVGYAAAVFFKGDSAGKKDVGTGVGLSEDDKALLIDIAKKSVEAKLSGKDAPDFEITSNNLKKNMGAFVTLKKKGRLRGCIGYIEAIKPLSTTVEEMAQAAAFRDPRFPPVKKEELKDLSFEISALTPLKRISDVNEIEVGKHGIYMVKGLRSGLLLPQVATEYKWDRLTFLEQTCYKAGLASGAWKDKETKIYIFSAEVFGEGK